MRKPGTDEDNVQMSDVLCDYCLQEWTMQRPMVEGHQGSCICGECLTLAFRAIELTPAPTGPTAPAGYQCSMCLEKREDPGWQTIHETAPARAALKLPAWALPHEPCVCRRCIKQAAAILTKDPDYAWRKPTA